MDNSNDRFYFRAEGAWRFLAFYYCLLFDVDGTLLDFNAAEDGALRDTLAHFSLPNTEDAVSQYHDINNALWAALEQGKIEPTRYDSYRRLYELAKDIKPWELK